MEIIFHIKKGQAITGRATIRLRRMSDIAHGVPMFMLAYEWNFNSTHGFQLYIVMDQPKINQSVPIFS